MAESCKLDPWPLDEGPRPIKSGKFRLNLHGEINLLRPKKRAQRRANDLEDRDASKGLKQGPTQGLNLLQMSPNWFLGNLDIGPLPQSVLKFA